MKILLGLGGSIATYRSPDVVRELKKQGHDLRVVLTPSAKNFVGEKVLETFSGQKVLGSDIFDQSHQGTDHIEGARWADVIVVYGATANTLNRLAAGLCDDFLALQILAAEVPVVFVPAMNTSMWQHPATQRSVKWLQSTGSIFVGPVPGALACGEWGIGHVASLEDLTAALKNLSGPKSLTGKRVLISAGPMQSLIDPVRRIQNVSSGHTGLEMALEAKRRGADVTLLLGPVDSEVQAKAAELKVVRYTNAESYGRALAELFTDAHVFVSAAAVLDFEIEHGSPRKLDRHFLSQNPVLNIKIKAVPDFVAQAVQSKRKSQVVVAFSLETGSADEMLMRAREKIKRKGADLIVVNASDHAERRKGDFTWWIFDNATRKEPERLAANSKSEFAKLFWSTFERRFIDGSRKALRTEAVDL
jgi:phosphopantothenoylcysteine decarboxylase/phosphopantothenate--cysteine ligase